jgi:hypothetical protein
MSEENLKQVANISSTQSIEKTSDNISGNLLKRSKFNNNVSGFVKAVETGLNPVASVISNSRVKPENVSKIKNIPTSLKHVDKSINNEPYQTKQLGKVYNNHGESNPENLEYKITDKEGKNVIIKGDNHDIDLVKEAAFSTGDEYLLHPEHTVYLKNEKAREPYKLQFEKMPDLIDDKGQKLSFSPEIFIKDITTGKFKKMDTSDGYDLHKSDKREKDEASNSYIFVMGSDGEFYSANMLSELFKFNNMGENNVSVNKECKIDGIQGLPKGFIPAEKFKSLTSPPDCEKIIEYKITEPKGNLLAKGQIISEDELNHLLQTQATPPLCEEVRKYKVNEPNGSLFAKDDIISEKDLLTVNEKIEDLKKEMQLSIVTVDLGEITSRFHHSSFLAGGDVAGAGTIKVIDGKMAMISDESGHYKPGITQVNNVISELEKKGIDIEPVNVKLGKKGDVEEVNVSSLRVQANVNYENLKEKNKEISKINDNKFNLLKNIKGIFHHGKTPVNTPKQKNIGESENLKAIQSNLINENLKMKSNLDIVMSKRFEKVLTHNYSKLSFIDVKLHQETSVLIRLTGDLEKINQELKLVNSDQKVNSFEANKKIKILELKKDNINKNILPKIEAKLQELNSEKENILESFVSETELRFEALEKHPAPEEIKKFVGLINSLSISITNKELRENLNEFKLKAEKLIAPETDQSSSNENKNVDNTPENPKLNTYNPQPVLKEINQNNSEKNSYNSSPKLQNDILIDTQNEKKVNKTIDIGYGPMPHVKQTQSDISQSEKKNSNPENQYIKSHVLEKPNVTQPKGNIEDPYIISQISNNIDSPKSKGKNEDPYILSENINVSGSQNINQPPDNLNLSDQPIKNSSENNRIASNNYETKKLGDLYGSVENRKVTESTTNFKDKNSSETKNEKNLNPDKRLVTEWNFSQIPIDPKDKNKGIRTEHTVYLGEDARKPYNILFNLPQISDKKGNTIDLSPNLYFKDHKGDFQIMDTKDGRGPFGKDLPGNYIFVMDQKGEFYSANLLAEFFKQGNLNTRATYVNEDYNKIKGIKGLEKGFIKPDELNELTSPPECEEVKGNVFRIKESNGSLFSKGQLITEELLNSVKGDNVKAPEVENYSGTDKILIVKKPNGSLFSENQLITGDELKTVNESLTTLKKTYNLTYVSESDDFQDLTKRFHHSSFLAGGDVAGAGAIKVIDGKLAIISDDSGHYKPGINQVNNVIDEIEKRGIKPESVNIHLTPKEEKIYDDQGNILQTKIFPKVDASALRVQANVKFEQKKLENNQTEQIGNVQETILAENAKLKDVQTNLKNKQPEFSQKLREKRIDNVLNQKYSSLINNVEEKINKLITSDQNLNSKQQIKLLNTEKAKIIIPIISEVNSRLQFLENKQAGLKFIDQIDSFLKICTSQELNDKLSEIKLKAQSKIEFMEPGIPKPESSQIKPPVVPTYDFKPPDPE